tara:strand:- start:13765 stop:14037 length:273 start_codon:yes stop_codon:yes gene_type:complete
MTSESSEILRGESVIATQDYDLFGNNVNNCLGIFLKIDSQTNKSLIYFPEFEEWAELTPSQFKREAPGRIPKENKEFISRVKTLEYSYAL